MKTRIIDRISSTTVSRSDVKNFKKDWRSGRMAG
jgi:hypothetical protein